MLVVVAPNHNIVDLNQTIPNVNRTKYGIYLIIQLHHVVNEWFEQTLFNIGTYSYILTKPIYFV